METAVDQKLLAAVRDGYELRVRKALKKGANPNLQSADGKPLVLLVDGRHPWVRDRIVDLLLAAGADEGPLLSAAEACGINRNNWPSTRYINYLTIGSEVIDRSCQIAYARYLLTGVRSDR